MAQGLGAAVKDHSFGERANALLDRLAQLQVEFGIPGVKVGATLSAGDKAQGSAVLEKLLEDAGRFQAYPCRQGLVVFGDAFQEAQLGDRPSHAGSTINMGHVRRAEEEIEDRMTGLFRTRLTRATPEQQRFLAAMAAVGDGPVERAANAAELGVATTAVSRPRQQLIDCGYIEAVGRGKLRLTIPGFAAHIGANG
jgi:hypothetical protein